MANDVRSTGRTTGATNASTDQSLSALLEALKSGDMDAAASAVGSLLRGRGAKIEGTPKDKGFWSQVKQAFAENKDRLTGPERKAVSEALTRAETPTTTTDNNGETRPAADANTMGAARRHAIIAERARRSALEQRVDVENMGGYVGQWDPKVAQAAIEKLDTAQATLEVERQNVQGAMTEIRRDITALESKSKRTEAEDLLLEGKRGQLKAFEGLDQVLGARIDQMAKSKGALKYDNFENERGKNEVSRDEALALAQHGASVDDAALAVAQVGMQADSNVLRATKLLEKQGGFKPEAATTPTPTTEGKTTETTEKKKTETAAVVDTKNLLPKAEVDKAVSNIALGVGTDKTKINSASAIFKELEGKTPEQIQQIKTAYNEKYGKAGKDANGAWEGGWDFDKNVRGNMHTWNKQAFDALAAGKPEAKQLIADGAKKDQEVNAGKIKADFSEPVVGKPTVTVKEGDWLSRIAANAKNKDGSPVTLDQLRQIPENKYIFDRNDKGDLIRPGDKVTLPDGSTHPAAELVKPDAKPDAKTQPGKVKTGLKKDEVKPDAKTETENKPEVKTEATPTYAQLSDKQVNDAVAAIANGVGANKGEMKSATAVFDAVNGMSPNQLAQVKEAYNKKYGAQGWDFDKHVKGAMFPWNQKAFEALEKGDKAGFEKLRTEGKKLDAQVDADTKALRTAVEGGGTDEKAIFDTLKKHQNNPEMMKAIEQWYKTQHKEDLRGRVKSELESGDFGEFRNTADDVRRANAMFDGKPNVASAALLHSLLADGSSNPEVALQVMTKELTPERRKAVFDEFKKLYNTTPEAMVKAMSIWNANLKADLIVAARDMGR